MHEINDLVKEHKLYLDEYVQTTRAARVASMLPTEGQRPVIVRQQNALDRLLERKICLLMELQEHRIVYVVPPPASDRRPTPPEDGGVHSEEAMNSRNELDDLLQAQGLTPDDPSKRTISEARNEVVGGVCDSAGPARPILEPTPHPSCSGWRNRRSTTPSPHGRGLLCRMGGWPATALSPAAAGQVRGHFIAAPTHHNVQKIVGTNSTIYCSQRA